MTRAERNITGWIEVSQYELFTDLNAFLGGTKEITVPTTLIGIIFATNRVGQLFKPKTRSTKRGLIGLEMAIKGVQEKGKIGATRATQMDIN